MKTSLTLAAVVGSIVLGLLGLFTHADQGPLAQTVNRDLYLKQLENDDAVPGQIDREYAHRQNQTRSRMLFVGGTCLFCAALAGSNLSNRRAKQQRDAAPAKPAGAPEW